MILTNVKPWPYDISLFCTCKHVDDKDRQEVDDEGFYHPRLEKHRIVQSKQLIQSHKHVCLFRLKSYLQKQFVKKKLFYVILLLLRLKNC